MVPPDDSTPLYCVSVNCTVIVMMIGTGAPFRRVGVNSHCLTASSAA